MRRITGPAEEAEIVDLAEDARGVAKIEGKAVFVADALPGERVVLRRTSRRRSYDEALLERVLRASTDRVAPGCAHFGQCGGCALQHLAPGAQLAYKQSQLLETLGRIGGVEPERVLAPLTGPVWRYRRRARLGVKFVPRKGRVLVGFRERSAPFVADLHGCPVLAPPADGLVDPLAELIGRLSIASRVPQVEVAIGDEACALVLRTLDPPTPADLEMLRSFEAAWKVRVYLQPGGAETVTPLTAGRPALHYTLRASGRRVEFEPVDFIQVNGVLNDAMVERAVEFLDASAGDLVLDLFCGLGNFTLALAVCAGAVTGVDGDAALVARAHRNAVINDLGNVSFHAANLASGTFEQPWAVRRYDRALLDPPRAGAKDVLPVVGACGASRVVYISCHPGSLARDAGHLVRDHGFRLAAAGVMDMFPHTTHVEAMAVFDR
jgi:23S rRNA (uracil1939-C5)-methyltransferase